MKLKTLVIIVAVLAILSGVVYVTNRPAPRPSDDPRVGTSLVSADLVEKAARVRITDQGKTVTVAKAADNSWQVATYHDFPADFSKLSNLIGDLTAAKVEQFVTARPEKLSRLEFKDTKIELLDASEKPLVSIVLGKSAEAGGRFVRFGDEQKAYRANLNVWLDTESKSWADSSLVPAKSEEIAKVEYSFADGSTIVAQRAKKEDAFTAENAPAGQRLKPEKVTSLLSTLTSLRFTETTEPSDANAVAAKENARTAKLTTFDGKTISVALGRKPEQKIIKPPAPKPDGSTGPAALGSVTELAKKDGDSAAQKSDADKAGATDVPAPAKLLEPETETIPAGPVFAFVSHSDGSAKINALMSKRAFQVGDWSFTSLPQKREEFFEAAPAPTPAPGATQPTTAGSDGTSGSSASPAPAPAEKPKS
jgi:hypothetical protein